MEFTLEKNQITVPLALKAHAIAEERFKQQKSSAEKAEQVYVNALAIYAVDYYLRCRGYQTDWEGSDSSNKVMRTSMNTADLVVENHGKIECRPVLPDSDLKTMYVPGEVWDDRIGYVAVYLNESLTEATLLGFVDKVDTEEVPLSELRSLDDFPFYLNQLRQASKPKLIPIKQWANKIFDAGWQNLEALAGLLGLESNSLVPAIRGVTLTSEPGVKAIKSVDLGTELGNKFVSLIVVYTQAENEKLSIRVQLQPGAGETYLPPNLQLILLDEAREIRQQVPSRSLDNYIRLKPFKCNLGERFTIKISQDSFSFTEEFIISDLAEVSHE